jgi:predicted nucleotidyltransferase
VTRSEELLALAQRIVEALDPEVVEEAAVTGSVSRGVADAVSDIEMLLVTPETLPLHECFALAAEAGLEQLDTWGPQGGPTSRVFGYCDRVPIELIWWSRDFAEQSVESLLAGQVTGSADAIVHARPLRTRGLLESWQARLTPMPPEVAAAIVEDAALTWGGFAPEGFLTIVRPGETISRLEYMLDDVGRMLRIVHAVNGEWPPTTKRFAARLEPLATKPDRFAERVEAAVLEQDLHALTQLKLEVALLAPGGPNIDRARVWLPRVLDVLS